MNFCWAPILTVVMLAYPLSVYAQDFISSLVTTTAPVQQEPRDGDDAWALDLVTSGGFDGTGIGEFSVNSRGMLTCSSTTHKCPDKLTAAALNSLAVKVKAAAAVSWPPERGPVVVSLCRDCVVVRLQLSMRQPDGSTKTLITYWDTASPVPEELLAIFNTLRDFGK